MDKDEILEKSRQENKTSDERDKFIELKAYQFSQRTVYAFNVLLCGAAAI